MKETFINSFIHMNDQNVEIKNFYMFVFFQFLINRVLDQGNKREKFLLINFLLFFFFLYLHF